MRQLLVAGLLALLVSVSAASPDLLVTSLNNCVSADSWSTCLKQQILRYLDDNLGTSTEARSLDTIDEAVVSRTFKYLRSFEYGVDLPFVDATLKYRPGRSLADVDVEFKDNEVVTSQARGLLKKKLLLPLLLLLKLKLKALMPIFVAIIGFKALKALVLSKLALLIVVAFVAVQLLKKGGLPLPGGASMDPVSAYGAPPLPSSTSGYEPVNTWDGNGPYSRVWSPSNGADAQSLAYNYYAPSSSSSSYGSTSSASSASSGSSGSSSSY